jgi:hypothetical protein
MIVILRSASSAPRDRPRDSVKTVVEKSKHAVYSECVLSRAIDSVSDRIVPHTGFAAVQDDVPRSFPS